MSRRPTNTRQISKINDHILLSGMASVNQMNMDRLQVTCIIDASNVPRVEVKALALSHIEYLAIQLDDVEDSDLYQHFDQAADLIEKHRLAGGKTLVHCAAGISRSTTLVLAYLMKYESMCLRDAFDLCLRKRPMVNPNLGFWHQLVRYERELTGTNTANVLCGKFIRFL